MAYLIGRKRKDSKTGYYAQFYDPHRSPPKKTLTLRTTDKAAARQKLAQLERDYAMRTFDPWADRVSREVAASVAVKEFTAAIRREVAAGDVSTTHAEGVVSTVGLFVRSLTERRGPGLRLDRVRADDVRAFLAPCKTTNTRWQYAARLRRFFLWAAATGAVPRSPMEDVRVEPPKRQPPRYLSPDEYDRLLQACAEVYAEVQETGNDPAAAAWWGPLFTFAAYTGLRNSEIRFLRWQDVDLRGGVVRIVKSEVFTPKWGKGRVVPLLPEARHALTDGHPYPDASREPGAWVWPSPHAGRAMNRGRTRTGQLNRGTLSDAFRTAADRAGLPDAFTFHVLRHTFASWAVQRGVPLPDLQVLMGHRHVATTLIYAHVSSQSVRDHLFRAFGAQ